MKRREIKFGKMKPLVLLSVIVTLGLCGCGLKTSQEKGDQQSELKSEKIKNVKPAKCYRLEDFISPEVEDYFEKNHDQVLRDWFKASKHGDTVYEDLVIEEPYYIFNATDMKNTASGFYYPIYDQDRIIAEFVIYYMGDGLNCQINGGKLEYGHPFNHTGDDDKNMIVIKEGETIYIINEDNEVYYMHRMMNDQISDRTYDEWIAVIDRYLEEGKE